MGATDRYVAKELSSGKWIVYDQKEGRIVSEYSRASGYRAELEAKRRNAGTYEKS